jgi:RimJ/RimL family protein N-acetyltransferase
MLKFMFALAFNALKCKRISVAVDAKNADCLKLVKKLGFKQEGVFRFQRDDGGDNVVLGMLKTECKWL